MAHKALIGGTAYEISVGNTLVGGTVFSIAGGKTLVDGTAYNIGFVPTSRVTISDTSYDVIENVYYEINGSRTSLIHETISMSLPVGTVIKIFCWTQNWRGCIYLNGNSVGQLPSSAYEFATYEYTVQDGVDISIEATSEYVDTSTTCGLVHITESYKEEN